MANILINCVSAGSGGALTYLKNLIPKLLLAFESNIKVDVFLLIKENHQHLIQQEIENYKKNIILAPNYGGYIRFLWEYKNLPKIIRDKNIEIIFTPYQIARIFKDKKNIIMFRNMEPFTFHKYSYSFKNRLRNYILKMKTIHTLKHANRVVAVSDYVKEFIIKNNFSKVEKITRIYHGRNTSFTSTISQNDSDILSAIGIVDHYIFTCGSLLPYRKCEDIIDAYSAINNKDIKLVIAGSGTDSKYAKKLDALISKRNLSDSVVMLGHVSLPIMIALYRNCRLFVTATETEACPNIAIEAMSSGCNILSSDILPLPEIFQDAATYFAHGDLGQFSQEMLRLFNDNFGVNKKAVRLIESFSWEKCANETYELIVNELEIN